MDILGHGGHHKTPMVTAGNVWSWVNVPFYEALGNNVYPVAWGTHYIP